MNPTTTPYLHIVLIKYTHTSTSPPVMFVYSRPERLPRTSSPAAAADEFNSRLGQLGTPETRISSSSLPRRRRDSVGARHPLRALLINTLAMFIDPANGSERLREVAGVESSGAHGGVLERPRGSTAGPSALIAHTATAAKAPEHSQRRRRSPTPLHIHSPPRRLLLGFSKTFASFPPSPSDGRPPQARAITRSASRRSIVAFASTPRSHPPRVRIHPAFASTPRSHPPSAEPPSRRVLPREEFPPSTTSRRAPSRGWKTSRLRRGGGRGLALAGWRAGGWRRAARRELRVPRVTPSAEPPVKGPDPASGASRARPRVAALTSRGWPRLASAAGAARAAESGASRGWRRDVSSWV
jgi:hypothetical protein